jgi:putative ABC transport system ATP-binding protein
MAVIELRDVSKLYGLGDATTVAIEEISLSVERGEFVAVMGPSGSGKTTLMNMIGLLDRPTHGLYRLEGKSVEGLNANARAKARRDRIGFVFQFPTLLPSLTVWENVALPLVYRRKSLGRRRKIAFEMLERVGLADRAYYLPHQLSGGQIQRATIARALINEPQTLIADEPTGNLDSESSRLVMELLSEIHRMGNTVIMVTHNPALTRYASRALYMHDGSIVKDETTKVGEVAETAGKKVVLMPTRKLEKDEEDDLAGVSALMGAIPKHGDDKPKKRAAPKKPRKRKMTTKKRKVKK